MKTLKFRQYLEDMILAGEKTTTWRLFDDKNLQVGDVVEFISFDTGKPFAKTILVSVVEKPLEKLSSDDWDGHEEFKDDEEMLKTYTKFYKTEVTLKTPIKIVKFELIEKYDN